MADISKCKGKRCKRKKTCYRFTAKDDLYQSYSNYDSFINKKRGMCDDYYPVSVTNKTVKGKK